MKIVQSMTPVALLWLSIGCASGGAEPASVRPGASQPLGREITTLRLRSGFVEIRTGNEGPSFSVLDVAGRPLAASLTEEELRRQFPTQSEALKTGLAGAETAGLLGARSELLAEAWGHLSIADR